MHGNDGTMTTDFKNCLTLTMVMAARALTRRYDEKLRSFGVSVAQFSVLVTVKNSKSQTVTQMAGGIAMDRTTLLRNLELLVRRELVRSFPAQNRNGRVFELTEKGAALLEELVPEWRKAQAEIAELLSGQDTDALLDSLRILIRG